MTPIGGAPGFGDESALSPFVTSDPIPDCILRRDEQGYMRGAGVQILNGEFQVGQTVLTFPTEDPPDPNTFLKHSADGSLEWAPAAAISGTIEWSQVLNTPTTLLGYGIGPGSIDHGQIGGLADDDHTQYFRADGTRVMTGNADWNGYNLSNVGILTVANISMSGVLTSTIVTGTAPFTIASTTLVTNLNVDQLDGQHGAYYLDSANFTGTDWTDLTDAGGTVLHSHALSDITNPTGNKTFVMTTRTLKFLWTNPAGNPLELEASGGYGGDLLHIHQSTGNPGATHLMTLEAEDTDVELLHAIAPATGTHVFELWVSGDTVDRWRIDAAGVQNWGPGNAAVDTTLYRDSVDSLTTDGAFTAGGRLKLTSGAFTIRGGGRLFINGTSGSEADGPHMHFYTAADTFPLLHIMPWTHDNITLNFDSYYNGGWKSSHSGSNFQIYKGSGRLQFRYESGVAAGGGVTWSTAFAVTVQGGLLVGNGATSSLGNPPLDVVGTFPQIAITDSTVDNSTKQGAISVRHYDNEAGGVVGILMIAAAAANTVRFGGGSSSHNAATSIEWYTAPTSTTTYGTLRFSLSGAGDFDFLTGKTKFNTVEYTWPGADGASGNVLSTNGAGVLSWTAAGSGTVSGTGTAGTIAKWSAATNIVDSIIIESGGKIGIGTTSPDVLLHLESSAAGGARMQLEETGVGGDNFPGIYMFNEGAWQTFMGWSEATDAFEFYHTDVSGSVPVMVYDNAGNVGIGTTTAFAGFLLNVSAAGGTGIRITDSTNGSSLRTSFVDDTAIIQAAKSGAIPTTIKFVTQSSAGSTTDTLVLNSTNVGIGTASPNELLHVAKNDGVILLTRASKSYGLRLLSDTTGGGWLKQQTKLNDDSTWQTFIQIGEGLPSATAHLTLQPTAGNVGIGTTGPGSKLHVVDAAAVQALFSGYAPVNPGAPSAQKGAIQFGVQAAYHGMIQFDDAGQTNFYIDTAYNSNTAAVVIRTKTAGTPQEIARFDSTSGLVLTGPLSAVSVSAPATPASTRPFYGVAHNSAGAYGSYLIAGGSSWTPPGSEGLLNIDVNGASGQSALSIVDGATAWFVVKAGAVTLGGTYSPQLTFNAPAAGIDLISFNMVGIAAGAIAYNSSAELGFGANGAYRMYLKNGMRLGNPTGGDKGAGTVNVTGDIYKNNTAYTNPDYVFELAHDKSARKVPYGYRIRDLEEIEAYTRAWYHLPGTHYNRPMGMFDRGDWLLEKVEETFLHLIAHHYQLSDFERRFKDHDSRIARLEDENKELRELVTTLRN